MSNAEMLSEAGDVNITKMLESIRNGDFDKDLDVFLPATEVSVRTVIQEFRNGKCYCPGRLKTRADDYFVAAMAYEDFIVTHPGGHAKNAIRRYFKDLENTLFGVVGNGEQFSRNVAIIFELDTRTAVVIQTNAKLDALPYDEYTEVAASDAKVVKLRRYRNPKYMTFSGEIKNP